jgi:hypothetical protein
MDPDQGDPKTYGSGSATLSSDAPVITRDVMHLYEVRVRHLRLPLSAQQQQQLCSYTVKKHLLSLGRDSLKTDWGGHARATFGTQNTDTDSNLLSRSFRKFCLSCVTEASVRYLVELRFYRSRHLARRRKIWYPSFIAVLRICDILVSTDRIRESVPLTYGSGSGSWYFRQWPFRRQLNFFCLLLFESSFTLFFKDKKS